MRRVPVTLLEPGMKVGRAVYSADGQMLINAGTVLTSRVISRLRDFSIVALYIDDGLSADIEVSDVIRDETRYKAVNRIHNLMQEATVQREGVGRTLLIGEEMANSVLEIIDELFESKDLVVNLADIRMLNDYTFFHSVNVCVLAVMTGITLQMDRKVLFHLGLGALLHDIGKVLVDPAVLNKPGPLTDEEFNQVKEHTTLGYKLLRQSKGISSMASLIALQHHERWNGQGYPEGLKGDQIHLLAAVTSVCDTFDALTSDRSYRKAHPIHEAYEFIASSGSDLFESNIVDAFLKNIAAYPSGTLVLLNTGEVGIVIDTPRGFGRHPNVRILLGSDGGPTQPYEISLVEKRGVVVKEVLSEPEIKQLRDMLRQ